MTAAAPAASRVASIRQRLLDRYAVERLLYRLSESRHRDEFLLKGAMLFALWFDQPHRPTRDADFLGFGSPDPQRLADIARELCTLPADDGLSFDLGSIRVEAIREEAKYDGLRMTLAALLGNARCSVQWDIGFGDAVTPAALEATYPVLLDEMPAPRLRVYPRETVFAEKLEAIAVLGIANSRMKDYFDLLALIREGELSTADLPKAVAATFDRRGTARPDTVPFGLTAEYSSDASKQNQWRAFLTKSRLQAPDLDSTVAEIRNFLYGAKHGE